MNININYIILILLILLLFISNKKYDFFSNEVLLNNDVTLNERTNTERAEDTENTIDTGSVPDVFLEKEEVGTKEKKNIYGGKLEYCILDFELNKLNDELWKSNPYCDITKKNNLCFYIEEQTKNFAVETGYGSGARNWSKKRRGFTNCIHQGDYALFKQKQFDETLKYKTDSKDELKCNAIPEEVLFKKNLSKWKSGVKEGNKINKQEIMGIEKMVKECYNKGDPKQKEYLINSFCNLIADNNEKNLFFNSPLRIEFCGTDSDTI